MRKIWAAATLAPLLMACVSTTLINSNPPGATLYLNGEAVGVTPFAMSDTKIVGTSTAVRLEAPGYQTLDTSISRNEELDVGALVAGIFLLVPFLWIEGYKISHDYTMTPGTPGAMPGPPPGRPPQDRPSSPHQIDNTPPRPVDATKKDPVFPQ